MKGPDILPYLKQGNLLLIKQDKDMAVLGSINSKNYAGFIQTHNSRIEDIVLLIPEIGQLTMYLQKVPDLAWDILEYSEKILQVIFPGGRNIPDFFLKSGGAIAIRLEKRGIFHKLLFNMGTPLVLAKVTNSFPEADFLMQYEKVLNLPENFEWKIKPANVMELGLKGEVKFH